MSNLWTQISRGARVAVALAAALLLLFSFAWVFVVRPLRARGLAEGQVQLTVIQWGEKNEDAIVAQLVKDFEGLPENRDIRIRRVNLGQAAAVNTKLQTMFAANDPPDVFYLGFEKVADFASKNLLADVEELIAADRAAGRETVDLDDYFPAVLKCFHFDDGTQRVGSGRLVALPKDFTVAGFYYNKDLLRRAGVPEPPPTGWTWDEFISTARAVARLPGCYGADFVTWESMVRLYLWNHGQDFADEQWEAYRFDDPGLRAALEKLRRWFHEEDRTLVSAKTQLETHLEPFLAGNVGLAGPFGRWKVPTYRLIRDFDWDIAPLPHEKGMPPRNGIFTTAWAIARDTPHKQAAWRFVKYLNSARGQALMCEAGLAIPVLKSVAYSPAFSQEHLKPKNWRVYLDAAEYAQPIDWPADPRYLEQLRVGLERIYKQNMPVNRVMPQVAAAWRENDRTNAARQGYSRVDWSIVAWALVTPLAALLLIGAARWWRRRPRGLAFGEEAAGSLMVSPWVIGFAAFTAFPVVMSLLLSFMNWSGMSALSQAQWVGVDNFVTLARGDARFRHSLYVTAWYALLAVPTGQLAALGAALLMNREWRSIGVFRAVWYLPSVLAGVGMAVMWKWVFHHEHGLMNAALSHVLPEGWHPPAWFEKDAATWAVPAFAIVNLWSIGGTMMVYLAGLKGIPGELYEAADIDGAVGWRKFVHVTLPMLSPVVLFNVIIAIIASFQVFTQAWIMTGGGPGDATRFYVVYLYGQAFDIHRMGYASALAWLLLVIVLALTLLVMRGSRRFVHYEGLKT